MGDCYTLRAESTFQYRIQGRGTGGQGPLLFLDQTEARRAEKNFLETPSPCLRVWMTPPPPPPPSQGLDTALDFRSVSEVRSSIFRTPAHTAKMCLLAG